MTVSVNGAELFYSTRGDGPACLVLSGIGTPPRGDMARVSAKAAAFFEEDASEGRKRARRDNLAKLPAGASFMQTVLAQTPMRFFDAGFDAAPLFAEAVARPGLIMHIMGTLAPAWDVTVGASALRVPIFIAHGRYDYIVPYVLWDGIPAKIPRATLHIFEQSGHQPFFEEPERFVAALTEWMTSEP